MTYAQRAQVRPSFLAPTLLALAIAASFAAGVYVGGPVLRLAVDAPRAYTMDATVLTAGRQWENQHQQQIPLRIRESAGHAFRAGETMLTAGQDWELRHAQQRGQAR